MDESQSTENNAQTSQNDTRSKVARLINTYDLDDGIGDELERLWTAQGDQRMGLRSLADRFNKRLLDAILTQGGSSAVPGEVDNLYRLLTSDEVTEGQRAEARERLRQRGVDISQLEKDFVTYQAIRSYLKEYRGAEYAAQSNTTQPEKVRQTVQRLISRMQVVTENSLKSLRSSGAVSIGEFRVLVDVNILCEDCGAQFTISELLQAGRCDCKQETTS